MLDYEFLRKSDVLLMLDPHSSKPPDESGANQVGVVVRGGQVLLCRHRKVVEISLAHACALAVRLLRLNSSELIRSQIEEFVVIHRLNYRIFLAALRAIQLGNLRFFERNDLMPAPPVYESSDAFEKRWALLVSTAQVGDLIAVRDLSSRLSTVIAWIDRGAWSHVALLTAKETLTEAITAGLVQRPLTTYRSSCYHVGLYRLWKPIDIDECEVRAQPGARYNYVGAAITGVRTLLHLPTSSPTLNGMIYSGAFFLVQNA